MKKPAAYWGFCPHCGHLYRLNQFGPHRYMRKHYQTLYQVDPAIGILGNTPPKKVRCPGSGKEVL